jgi:hypothetical protein
VTDHATYGRTCSGAKQAAAEHVTGYATNDGTGGRAFFLMCHASTSTEAQSGDQKNGG